MGRTGNLIFSLFAFQIYVNLLNLGQNWIATRAIGFGEYMIYLHGGVMVLGMLWLAVKHHNWNWGSLPGLSAAKQRKTNP